MSSLEYCGSTDAEEDTNSKEDKTCFLSLAQCLAYINKEPDTNTKVICIFTINIIFLYLPFFHYAMYLSHIGGNIRKR